MDEYLQLRDFHDQKRTRLGASITRTPITKTVSGDYGDIIETTGTNETIVAYVQAGVKSSKETTITGQVSDVDLKLEVAYNQTIGIYDKFTYQGDVYQVKIKEDINEVYVQNYLIYKVISLYRLS